MRLLIVSAPRSGTMYAAHFFTALGIETLHEAAFNLHGDHDWDQPEGCSSWLAAPYLHESPTDLLILHQLRDIKLSAASLERHCFFHHPPDEYTIFAKQHVRIPRGQKRAFLFQICWHRLIHERLRDREHITYWVEDLDVALGTRICALLGHKPTRIQREQAAQIPHDLHTNLTPAVTTDLLYESEKIPDRNQAKAGA